MKTNDMAKALLNFFFASVKLISTFFMLLAKLMFAVPCVMNKIPIQNNKNTMTANKIIPIKNIELNKLYSLA